MNLKNILFGVFGIEIIENMVGRCVVVMLVDKRMVQFFGYLYGGVLAVLVEIAVSVGVQYFIDQLLQVCVGFEINVNYLKFVKEGGMVMVIV